MKCARVPAARFWVGVLPVLLLLLSFAASAGPPGMINYQGLLTDDSGDPIDGSVDLEFAIYDTTNGGASLWSEAHPGVVVTQGDFQVALGSTAPLDSELFADDARWLETRVDGVTLTPRRRLLAVPYALRAGVAEVALDGGGGGEWTPSGSDIYRLNGNIGIGTATPSDRLHILDPTFAHVKVERTAGSTVRLAASTTSASIGTTSSHPFRLITDNTVRMAIDAAGLVGIGTTTPLANLQVNGGAARAIHGLQSGTSGSLVGVMGETNSITGTGVRGQANHATGVTYGVHGQATGSGGTGVLGEALGNGAASYGVQGSTSSTTGRGVFGVASALVGTAAGVHGRSASPDGVGVYGENAAGGDAAYFSGNTATTGSHRVGSVSPLELSEAAISAPVDLLLSSGHDLTIESDRDLSLASARSLDLTSAAELTLDGSYVRADANLGLGVVPTHQLHLSLNSAAKPTSNTWTISSDRRLKHEIQPIASALERLLRLRGVTYRWKNPAAQGGMQGTYMGLIAQEVQEVFPEWVSQGLDGYLTLTVSGFEGLTAEAMRELHDRLELRASALAARCEQLEARLAAVEARLASSLPPAESARLVSDEEGGIR